jgi:hypothetical protein
VLPFKRVSVARRDVRALRRGAVAEPPPAHRPRAGLRVAPRAHAPPLPRPARTLHPTRGVLVLVVPALRVGLRGGGGSRSRSRVGGGGGGFLLGRRSRGSLPSARWRAARVGFLRVRRRGLAFRSRRRDVLARAVLLDLWGPGRGERERDVGGCRVSKKKQSSIRWFEQRRGGRFTFLPLRRPEGRRVRRGGGICRARTFRKYFCAWLLI